MQIIANVEILSFAKINVSIRLVLDVDTAHTVEPYFHTILKAKTLN